MIRLAAVAAVILMSVPAFAFEAGDSVVVLRRARLTNNGQAVDSVSPGLQLKVLAAEGDRIQVSNGATGWLERRDVATPEQAVEFFSSAVRSNPRDGENLFARANVLRTLGKYDLAIEDFNRLVRMAPQAAALNGRGRTWFEMGNYDNAIADFTKAIEQSPGAAMLYNNRSAAWEMKGNHERALADLDEAHRREPNHDFVQHNRNRLLQARQASTTKLANHQAPANDVQN